MENYALIEHFKLVKNGTVEGIKCDYFQGSQGNILLKWSEIIKFLKIKNDGDFCSIYEDKYFDELYPYYHNIFSLDDEDYIYNDPRRYLEPEGLRKIIELTKEDPEIISELDL